MVARVIEQHKALQRLVPLLIRGSDLQRQRRQLGGIVLFSSHVGRETHRVRRGADRVVRGKEVMRKAAASHQGQIVSQGFVQAMIGVGEEQIELAVVEGIEVHLPVLQVVLLNESCRFEAGRDLGPDGVIGADGFVGGVPEPEGLLRNSDAEAALEIAYRLAGGVAHDHLDRIRGMLGHEIGEGVAAAVAAPALAGFVASRARTLFDHILGAAARAAGDGWIRLW